MWLQLATWNTPSPTSPRQGWIPAWPRLGYYGSALIFGVPDLHLPIWLVLGHTPGCGIRVDTCISWFVLSFVFCFPMFIGIQRGSGVDWRFKRRLLGDFWNVSKVVYHFDLRMFIDTSLLCIALLDAGEIRKKWMSLVVLCKCFREVIFCMSKQSTCLH